MDIRIYTLHTRVFGSILHIMLLKRKGKKLNKRKKIIHGERMFSFRRS
jgi:hypothetical protein